jgi:uncharacterized protein YceH (UPF0502 family)/SAM-dependent methyltransferase
MELDAVEQRVLGSLLEKERTVPATYPLTLNALRSACNQSSGRDPVVDLGEHEILTAIDRLKADGLARIVHAGAGSRATKYRQVLDERLDLDKAQRAVITLLLLRGPQTPGELRSRSDRLYEFHDLDAVDRALQALRARDEPLVAELERRPGQKERRWTHLLGPVAAGADAPASNAPDAADSTEEVLAGGSAARDERVRTAYDTVARGYAADLLDELDGKPFDRWLLERLAGEAATGPVADVGCGPGHVGAHLALAGADVTGFDLSPAMVEEARRLFPELSFAVADLRAVPPPDHGDGWSLIVAWYSLVHLAGSELPGAIAALAKSLRTGGTLAVAVHLGSSRRHLDQWFGESVDIDFTLHDPDQVLAACRAAGLTDIEWYQRGPYAGHETDTTRLYVLGRRGNARASTEVPR